MNTLKLVGGFVIFMPLFIVVMWLPSTLTSRGRSGFAWLTWFGGLALWFVLITIYGRAVR